MRPVLEELLVGIGHGKAVSIFYEQVWYVSSESRSGIVTSWSNRTLHLFEPGVVVP